MSHDQAHPFYGHEIYPNQEKKYIESILSKYRNEIVDEELKKKIWDELQIERYHGRIKIPFKVVLRIDTTGKFPNCVEVILDTKI